MAKKKEIKVEAPKRGRPKKEEAPKPKAQKTTPKIVKKPVKVEDPVIEQIETLIDIPEVVETIYEPEKDIIEEKVEEFVPITEEEEPSEWDEIQERKDKMKALRRR